MKAIRVIIFVLGVAVVLCGSTAKADLINGGFETGDLTGWTAFGAVQVVTDEYPRDFLGLPQAPYTLDTVWGDPMWLPTEGDYFASLWSTGWSGILSQLSLTFTTPADGWVLEFDYFYDFGDEAPYYDPVSITVVDSSSPLAFFSISHNDPFIGTVLADDENIDWTTVSVILPKADTYTLWFEIGEFTQLGEAFESILGVDNVSVVPLPSALVLGSIGLGYASWRLRKQKVAKPQ